MSPIDVFTVPDHLLKSKKSHSLYLRVREHESHHLLRMNQHIINPCAAKIQNMSIFELCPGVFSFPTLLPLIHRT